MMSSSAKTDSDGSAGRFALPTWIRLEGVTVRSGEESLFPNTSWVWKRGEQWAILGPNGSGKSVLGLAIAGQMPVVKGEVACEFEIALLSPQVQREMMLRESSFYQSRWHSGLGEGERTVEDFLSQASVEQINPYEANPQRGNARVFRERRRQLVEWLGLEPLMGRRLVWLSNGEQRKVLLAHILLRGPELLVLDDPFGGLDVATRRRLRQVIGRLMKEGFPVLVVTSRPDEVPASTTHLMLVQKGRVVAQGAKKGLMKHALVQRLNAMGKASTGNKVSPNNCRRVASGKPLVQFRNVTVQAGGKRILEDITWSMRQGEHWALLGPNGSGKTTLLSLIQGDNPQAYALDMRLFDKPVDSTRILWQARQKIGAYSPELQQHYPPGWNCLDVVCSGFFNTIGLYQACTRKQRASAQYWLDAFGLGDAAGRSFGEVSLAEQRFVLLARAVVKEPALLILDEVCQGLDAAHRGLVLDTVDRVVAQTGASLLFVTHHAKEMPRCITRVLELRAGRVKGLKNKNYLC